MNNNSNNCGDCGTTCSECGRPWAICKQDGGCGCNKCKDIKFCEYGRMANGCIREKQPGCPMQAVIPSVTVESIEGIKNLADCLVHVSDINTTFYIDDKHRPIITWAGPVDIPGYDMESNPNNYRDQIVTDVANQEAVIYDKSGRGYVFGLVENIDLQEQVNNKLDEMVESGEFDTILANYLVICGGNAKALGCEGDGVTDDTTAINTAITSLATAGINKLVFPEGEYVISNTINIPSNFELTGMKGAVLKYVGEGSSGTLINIQGDDSENYKENITISNLKIDGTNQTYKGGYSMETPNVTHTNPCAIGLKVINVRFARNVTIEDCTINDIYGDGIAICYCSDVRINNNRLYSVGAGNIQISGQTGYDSHGDGIAAYMSFNVIVNGNTVINKRVYQAGIDAAEGKPCGRSGIEFEYPLNMNYENNNPDDIDHNAVDSDIVPLSTVGEHEYRRGNGLVAMNNYVYGYTKGVHMEANVICNITDNTVIYNHIGILSSNSARTKIINNYVDPQGVGQAPQSGYNGYYGCIAITNYTNYEDTKTGVISNNTLLGDGKGITVARDKWIITNNNIRCKYGVYGHLNTVKYITISNNSFSDCEVSGFASFIYAKTTHYWSILNNMFVITSTPTYSIQFDDTNTFNLLFKNNLFTSDETQGEVVKLLNLRRCVFESNNFVGECETFIRGNTGYSLTFINNSVSEALNNVLRLSSGFYQFNKIDNNYGHINNGTGYGANNSTAQMKDGFFNQGQTVIKYNPINSTTIRGWSCIAEGFYTDTLWSSSPSVGHYYLNSADKVYLLEEAGEGSATDEPTHVSGSVTGADGYKWKYAGSQAAAFKTLGF